MTTIIDGKKIAAKLCESLIPRIKKLDRPRLVAIIVGDDPASNIYVKLKERTAAKIGITTTTRRLPDETTEEELLGHIHDLNKWDFCHGILVQLPLPAHIRPSVIFETIDPLKDVDGFNPINVGRTAGGDWSYAPCTPKGIIKLLEATEASLRGASALVVGTSAIVGRPTALMLSKMDCTVTMANSKTRNLRELCRQAEILVVAAGRPHMIPADYIKRGSIIIDVGINRISDTVIVGDVAFDDCVGLAGAITPVPGGVGPMTVACLMENTVIAAENVERR